MGDMNAKVGANACLELSGIFSLGELKEHGEKLHQWQVESKICITNTQFLKPKKKNNKAWISPDTKQETK